jgi:NitT/TauT family transport system substrate-binding protein
MAEPMVELKRTVLAALTLSMLTAPVLTAPALAEETVVRIGNAPSIGSGALLIASERGYFKEVGIRIEIERIDSSSNAMVLLAQNRYQILEGGISAGYFNAIAKGLPITMAMSRVSTPILHKIMLRADLKDQIKDIAQLKGHVIATNGPGSVSTYEIGKILQTAGLTLHDVEIKVIPFAQYAIAFANKAVDAALAISPFTFQLQDRSLAVPFAESDVLIKPSPLTISANMINTEWAAKNPEVARKFYLAALRGARDYCQAYHGGAVRKEMIDLLVKSGTERRPEVLHQYPWPSRDPNGGINVDSMLDIQNWYVANKYVAAASPADKLANLSYVQDAARKLGPFVLENKDSKTAGCR